jgi:hypothetical protein
LLLLIRSGYSAKVLIAGVSVSSRLGSGQWQNPTLGTKRQSRPAIRTTLDRGYRPLP